MAGVNQGGGGESEVRIVLVGKSGGGRSTTGNSILGQKEFKSTLGIKSTTLTCQSRRGSWEGRALLVVDTADIFSSLSCSEDSLREIVHCIDLSRPGPHALVFVTQVGRFTAEDEAAANQILDVFGEEAARFTVVLFTRREDLGGEPLWDYIKGSNNKAVLALIQKCGDRFCAFNNRAVGEERERQVSELMGMVGRIVQENGGHYINELYSEPSLTTAKVRSFVAQSRRARQGWFWGLTKRWQVSELMGMFGRIVPENGRHNINKLYLELSLTPAKLRSFIRVSTCRTCVAIFVLVAVGLALLALCLGPFLIILVLAAPFLLAVWIICCLFRVLK